MKYQIPIAIKNIDYSSPDCQRLIREYTKIITKMIKEYDLLVRENKELIQRVEQLNAQLQAQLVITLSNKAHLVSTGQVSSSLLVHNKSNFSDLLRKFWRTLLLCGWRVTLQKVQKRLFHKK